MIIEFAGKEYQYDPAMIDMTVGMRIKEHTGQGMRSWEKSIDDGDPKALQALYWVVLRQNGENVPLQTLNFSLQEFYSAVAVAAAKELTAQLLAKQEAALAAGGDEPDPTETAD